jgi:hypothetical protein
MKKLFAILTIVGFVFLSSCGSASSHDCDSKCGTKTESAKQCCSSEKSEECTSKKECCEKTEEKCCGSKTEQVQDAETQTEN